jgi:hypothetical protein
MDSQDVGRRHYRSTMKKKQASYRVLAIPALGAPIDDALVYELTFESEASPHDILRESAGIDKSSITTVNQASYTPGAYAWTVMTRTGACYYVFQHNQSK